MVCAEMNSFEEPTTGLSRLVADPIELSATHCRYTPCIQHSRKDLSLWEVLKKE